MAGCRDCDICTRTSLNSCIITTGRIVLALCTFFVSEILIFLVNSGKRKCPTCGHPLSVHQKDREGRFID